MTWLVRLAILLILFVLLRWGIIWLWRWFVRGGWVRLFTAALERHQEPPPVAMRAGTMKRDPVCGTYVATELAVEEKVNGEVLYFCSERCRQQYRGARQALPQGSKEAGGFGRHRRE